MSAARRLVRPVARPIRRLIRVRRLPSAIQRSGGRVIVGSSGVGQDGWVATDRDVLDLLRPEMWGRVMPEASLAAIAAEHVWEHLTLDEGRIAAQICYRFLRPGGYLRVAVPDGNDPNPVNIEEARPGGTAYGSDDHKVLYTCGSLRAVLHEAGFETCLLEYFDEAGVFREAPWDPSEGMIHRSHRFDERNDGGRLLLATSLIVDARKPMDS